MSNALSITELFTDESFKSTIEIFASILGILGSIFAAGMIILKYLNKPLNGESEYLSKAGIPNWTIRLFSISIPLKKTPQNTFIDKILSGFIIFSVTIGLLFVFHMHIQTLRIQNGWTLLTLKTTNESFFITNHSAKESSLFSRHPWSIDKKQCIGNSNQLKRIKNISPELSSLICEIFNDEKNQIELNKYIDEVKKDKIIIYPILTIIGIILFWLIISISLTLSLKRKVRNYIIKQQERAYYFIT
ncbi:TPA: DUF6216 family protein [Serratia marcescens]